MIKSEKKLSLLLAPTFPSYFLDDLKKYLSSIFTHPCLFAPIAAAAAVPLEEKFSRAFIEEKFALKHIVVLLNCFQAIPREK